MSKEVLDGYLSPSLDTNHSFYQQEHADNEMCNILAEGCDGVKLNHPLVFTWHFQSGSLSHCLSPTVSHSQQSRCTVIHSTVCFCQRTDFQIMTFQFVLQWHSWHINLVVTVFPEHIPRDLKFCVLTAGYVDRAGNRDRLLLFSSNELRWLFDIYRTSSDCRNSEDYVAKLNTFNFWHFISLRSQNFGSSPTCHIQDF